MSPTCLHPVVRYVVAVRPAFLIVTLVGALLGLASAAASGVPIDAASAGVALLFALVAHAGVNVLNDCFDARNGTDAWNDQRVSPFTGGSRVIQDGVLSQQAMATFGYALLLAVVPAGLWLTTRSVPGLLLIGLCGLFAGWAYSAPPLHLVNRGLGEVAVTCGWLMVVVGTDLVQRQGFAFAPFAAGLGFALLVANLLYINQFPDAKADARAGKRTLVVRLGADRARAGHAVLLLLAALWTAGCILAGALPRLAAVSLLALLPGIAAARGLWRHAAEPARLRPAIQLTILAAVAYGLLLAGALCLTMSARPGLQPRGGLHGDTSGGLSAPGLRGLRLPEEPAAAVGHGSAGARADRGLRRGLLRGSCGQRRWRGGGAAAP
jgi:1,4-dihydroxy-2-naphthoate octaprenyltransferase